MINQVFNREIMHLCRVLFQHYFTIVQQFFEVTLNSINPEKIFSSYSSNYR